jgi:hypothetical protein
MSVRRKRRVLAQESFTTRDVLFSVAAVGALGAVATAIYEMSKPSTAATKTTTILNPTGTTYAPPQDTNGNPPTTASLSGIGLGQLTDCSSFYPDALDDSAVGDLASYGACAGENAAINAIMNLGIVQSIESAIQAGSFEAAQFTGLINLGIGMVDIATDIDVTAATSVMPVVGVVLTVVLTLVNVLNSVLSAGPQIYVPNQNATGSDSIQFVGPDGVTTITYEKINLADYPGFVSNAMNWINANPKQALQMTAEEFSLTHNVFLTQQTPAQMNSGVWDALDIDANEPIGAGVYATLAQNPPPGAYEMLRSIQLPAAAAVVSSLKTYAGFLCSSSTSGVGAPILRTFPALTASDVMGIFTTSAINDAYNNNLDQAASWVNAQCPPPDVKVVMSKFRLCAEDACNLINAWTPTGDCYATAATYNCTLTTYVAPMNTGASASNVFALAPSTGAKIATGTAVVAGGLGVAFLGYKLWTGYSTLQTAKSLWSDIGKGANAIKSKFSENPLALPGRTSATGGRLVAYRVRLEDDVVRFEGRQAVLYRHDVAVATFKPSAFQKTKIRSGRGEVLVFQDQLIGGSK